MSREELAATFLFAGLDTEQLDELDRAGSVERYGPGEVIFSEGELADHLWVLLDGSVTLTRRLQQEDAVMATMQQPGTWAGGLRAYGDGADAAVYLATGRVDEPTRLFRLPSEELARLLSAWFPLGKFLLDGIFHTIRRIDAMARQNSAMAALGTLAAGLAHELNNPASASAQGARALEDRLGAITRRLTGLAGDRDGGADGGLAEVFEATGPGRGGADPLADPLAAADAEARLGDRVDALGADEPWQLAADLSGAGIGESELDRLVAEVPDDRLPDVLGLLADLAAARALVRDLGEATGRISGLVAAVRDYSQLDRAPIQDVDLAEGIESTLSILAHRLGDRVTLVRDIDPSLPSVPGHPAELNQVWTNLVDNAIDAVADGGTVTVRAFTADDAVVVEIVDDGPGVPPEVRERVFEAFFTTKEPGRGTGLGLDIARRIVVDRHHGTIELDVDAGVTIARVQLPRERAPA